jgi:hypothetical protein
MPAPSRGLQYEINVSDHLKEKGLVDPGHIPAGGRNDVPDLTINHAGISSGVELKYKTQVSAGSITLHYDKTFKEFYIQEQSSPEGLLMKNVLEESGNLHYVNHCWTYMGQEPKLFTEPLSLIEDDYTREVRYREEYKRFKTISGQITPTIIEEYYNAKNCWYLNFSTLAR